MFSFSLESGMAAPSLVALPPDGGFEVVDSLIHPDDEKWISLGFFVIFCVRFIQGMIGGTIEVDHTNYDHLMAEMIYAIEATAIDSQRRQGDSGITGPAEEPTARPIPQAPHAFIEQVLDVEISGCRGARAHTAPGSRCVGVGGFGHRKRYRACRICARGGVQTGAIYVASYGEKFHVSNVCSGLRSARSFIECLACTRCVQ